MPKKKKAVAPVVAPVVLNDGLALPAVKLTKVSLSVPDSLPAAKLRDVLVQVAAVGNASPWWVGDLMCHAKKKWGKWDELFAGIKLPWGKTTCQNFAAVSKAVETSRRREVLPWSFHAAVAAKSADKQTEWLQKAVDLHLNLKRFRASIAADEVIEAKPKAVGIKPDGRLKLWEVDDAALYLGSVNDHLPATSEIADCKDAAVLDAWLAALLPLVEFHADLSKRRAALRKPEKVIQKPAKDRRTHTISAPAPTTKRGGEPRTAEAGFSPVAVE